MAENGLPALDQTIEYASCPWNQGNTVIQDLSPQQPQQQQQQICSALIEGHHDQTDNLGEYGNGYPTDANDEQGFWAQYVDLNGKSTAPDAETALPPGVPEFYLTEAESPLNRAGCHLTADSGSDFLATPSSRVRDLPSLRLSRVASTGREHNVKNNERHRTTTAEAQQAAALTQPDGEDASIYPGTLTPTGEIGHSQALGGPRLPSEPQTVVASLPDRIGLAALPSNDAFCCVAPDPGIGSSGDSSHLTNSAEPQPRQSRLQRPSYSYITGLSPESRLSNHLTHHTAISPTLAMPRIDAAAHRRMPAMIAEDVSYPSPQSECAVGSCSPPATTPSFVPITMGSKAPSPPTSIDVTRSTSSIAFKRDRDPPRNEAGEIYCDYPDCHDQKHTFRRPCEWNKHMDKHERPYKCQEPECNKLAGFTYSGGLLRHQREVHKKRSPTQRLMWCPVSECNRSSGKPFTRHENLKEHIRRVHEPTKDPHHDAIDAGNRNHESASDLANRPGSTSPTSATPRSPPLPMRKRRRPSDSSGADNVSDDNDVHSLREKVKQLRRENQEKDERVQQLEAVLKDLRQRAHVS